MNKIGGDHSNITQIEEIYNKFMCSTIPVSPISWSSPVPLTPLSKMYLHQYFKQAHIIACIHYINCSNGPVIQPTLKTLMYNNTQRWSINKFCTLRYLEVTKSKFIPGILILELAWRMLVCKNLQLITDFSTDLVLSCSCILIIQEFAALNQSIINELIEQLKSLKFDLKIVDTFDSYLAIRVVSLLHHFNMAYRFLTQ